MMMRFTIEQRHLTDPGGRPTANDPDTVSFHTCEAQSADAAVRLFLDGNGGAVIGDIVKFPGMQAVATMRNATGVYTLQVTPSSQNLAPIGE
jgi:hypothetical protein